MLKTADSFPAAIDGERRLDRRRFVCVAGGAALLTLAGEWLARAIAVARPREVQVPEGQTLAVGEACALTDAAGAEALVVRVDVATVVAFDRRCPHLGCPVLWRAERGRFECPCHHAAFDARSGAVLFGPPQRGLQPLVVHKGGGARC